MTKEEILAMEAGRMLDVRVSDVLFGTVAIVPEYSTDISAAWQVVEKVKDKGICIIHSPRYSGNRNDWEVHTNWDADEAINEIVVNLLGLPEAICKAALLAKLEAGNRSE